MSRKSINSASNQLFPICNLVFAEVGRKMPNYICWECEPPKTYKHWDSLRRHRKLKHLARDAPRVNVGFGNVTCNLCGQVFASQRDLERHIRINRKNCYKQVEQYDCLYCTKIFPKVEELDEHIKIHYLTPENLAPHKSNIIFHHPFTMIVAGPTRSGKIT